MKQQSSLEIYLIVKLMMHSNIFLAKTRLFLKLHMFLLQASEYVGNDIT